MGKRILTVVTKTTELTLMDGSPYASGYWAEELATPYVLFREAGYELDIATIGAAVPRVDASSLNPQVHARLRLPSSTDPAVEVAQFKTILDAIPGLQAPLALESIGREQLAGYAGVFIPGGNGAIADLPSSPAMAVTLLRALDLGLGISSVCHGPAALLAPRDGDGINPFRGYRLTSFSKAEDDLIPAARRLPLIVELELRLHGAQFSCVEPWGEHVVADRRLVTGQNSASSGTMARAFLELLAQL